MSQPVVTLAFLGDVMLGRMVSAELGRHPPEWFWGTTLSLLRSATTVIANLECAITTHDQPWQRSPKVFHFRADPMAIEVLKAGNIGCVSLANNHSLDFEVAGLTDTLQRLDQAGIRHVGAGADSASAEAPIVLDVGGVKLGLMAFTDNEPDFAASSQRPGTHYRSVRRNRETLRAFLSAAGDLRRKDADLVVLSVHWGPNMVLRPPPHFRAFARELAAEVDIFHGHSAHLFQGVEAHGRRLILYDTGDFLDDYAIDPTLRNDWSFVFLVEADHKGARRLRLIPVVLSFAQTNVATGAEAKAICQRMKELSGEFGVVFEETPEGLALDLGA